MARTMELDQRLELLMSLAVDDREGAAGAAAPRSDAVLPPRLRHAGEVGALRPLNIRTLRPMPGMKTSLLRVLMTNACSFNCHYCPMRRDRAMPRTLLKPEELVRIFLGALRRGWCEGLFVTTGIPGRPVKVMDDLIHALELLRERHRFAGYIHVKIVPGAEAAQVERITALASRVSLNLEAACGESLARIAPDKSFDASMATLDQARQLVVREREAEDHGRPRDRLHPGGTSGMTMQFVVGATPDTDRSLIGRITELYARGGIHHAQFSAFRPIRDTPMEEVRATPVLREHRLYQADYLLRRYGFGADELVYDGAGNLPLAQEPKVAWALAHPERFPVEIRTASRSALVRVPGIGPATARRIVAERGTVVLRGLSDLRRLGVVTSRAAGFLTLGGRRLQTTRWAEQLGFWGAEEEAGVPQVIYEVSPGTFR
ncbi:MAG: Radical domain protein [Gemmatimonadetes bacterium]|jgi:predicted DNA-binding helix-hairpin-helix protein|nr:Radical domain protein [Gemmatimonadota bacterium]